MSRIQKLWTASILMAFVGVVIGVFPSQGQEFESTTTVILVRHAEAGDGDDPDLTELGRERAIDLLHALEGVELDAVHSTPLNRTLQTAQPIAHERGLEIITTDPTRTFAEDMAAKLRANHEGQTVLVVSHSNTVPAIVNALGGGAYDQLDHEEYDSLFVVTLHGDETRVMRLQYGSRTP